MRKRGLTYSDIGDTMGVSRSLVGHWLTGRRDPKIKYIKQIAITLGVTLKDLIGDDAIILSKDQEVSLVEVFRGLSDEHKAILINMAEGLGGNKTTE